jgi:zinc protease
MGDEAGTIGNRLVIGILTLLLSALFLVLPAISARAAVAIQEVRSDKGITAWLVEDYTLPIIAVHFAFDGGSTQDPPGKEGLANLMSGLFDEGAGDLDSDAFQTRLDDAGAEMAFSETRDAVYGSMRMLAERRDEAFGLLGLAVQKPRFDEAPIERIRAQILARIAASERDPDAMAARKWSETIYGGHPYSRPGDGTRESVASLTAEDLRSLHGSVFARSGLTIAVVGAIDAETLKRKLDEVFGDLPEKQALQPVPDVEPKLGKLLEVNYDRPQTSLKIAYPGARRDAPDFYAAALMNQVLGGSTFTSRLFEEVRNRRGLAYSVGSALAGARHSAALIISTATRSDRAAETLAVIRDIVRHMAAEGPTEVELADAKKYVVGAYAINNLGSSGDIASTLVELQLDGLGIDYMDRRASLIEGVTLEQVKAVAAKLLSADPSVMVVGPPLAGGGKG